MPHAHSFRTDRRLRVNHRNGVSEVFTGLSQGVQPFADQGNVPVADREHIVYHDR